MAEVKRPLSLQLGSNMPSSTTTTTTSSQSLLKTPTRPSKASAPRPQTIAIERTRATTNNETPAGNSCSRQQLTSSLSSGSLASFASSSVSTSSSSSTSSASSSASSSFSPRSPIGCAADTPDSPSLILPYLYVGDQAQTQIDTISSLNISYILSLQSLPKFLDSDVELEESFDGNHIGPARQSETNPSIPEHAPAPAQVVGSPPSASSLPSCSATSTTQAHHYCSPIVRRAVVGSDGQLVSPSTGHHQTSAVDDGDIGSDQQAGTSCEPQPTSSMVVDGELCEQIASETVAKELLPSINSSKDYLVKFRSCVNRLIKGKCINISDTFEQYVDRFFDETHNFIEEARRNRCNILVHCKAGISRSPTIAIAYLMKWKRLHLQDAYDFVKRCRPQISPNLNFMGQLMNYERRLLQRGLHKASFLPSPTTSHCLLSHSCHEQPSHYKHQQASIKAKQTETGTNEVGADDLKMAGCMQLASN